MSKMEGRDCYTCAERHARRARRSEIDHPTLSGGRDKQVPPKRTRQRGPSEGKFGAGQIWQADHFGQALEVTSF